jgi:predicted DNA binding CopG/RHH family protein
VKHSQDEDRYYALGRTSADRRLFVAFTMRGTLVRVISARDMSRTERRAYATHLPSNYQAGRAMSKKIPRFASEEEERDFWAEHDSTGCVDWSGAERVVLSNLKPSTTTISLRLPEHMLNDIKMIANKRDVPYQSLMKSFLADRLDDELRGTARRKVS